jgi:polyhydroxyalkanoate synthesis regulator phasin
MTQRGAGAVVRTVVRQGEVAADRAEQVVADLIGRAAHVGLARQSDLDELGKRVSELEEHLAATRRRQRGR